MRVPWTARKSNQSILKEINLEYSLEGLMLKLKLQYFGHLMQRADSLGKTLMLGKIEGRRRGRQRIRWLDGITELNGLESEQTPGVGEGQGDLACCSPWGCKELDTTERLNNNNRCAQSYLTLCGSIHCSPPNFSVRGMSQARTVEWVAISYSTMCLQFSSVQFSCSAMSDSLQPHGLQHARSPCPSPTTGVYPNSCPSCP